MHALNYDLQGASYLVEVAISKGMKLYLKVKDIIPEYLIENMNSLNM